MAKNTVDLIDVPSLVVFMFAGLFSLILKDQNLTIAGFDPMSALITLPGDTVITAAMVLQIAALAAVFVTNKPELDLGSSIEAWLFVATVALVVLPPFVPMLSAILGATVAGIAAFIIQSFGISILAYEPA